MSYTFSRCFALQTPEPEKAVEFYRKVFGLELAKSDGNEIELQAGQFRFFLDKGPSMGPIMEFVVPNLDRAKAELLDAGCEIIRWGGLGKPC
jgi:catechol 2,3-dioxygenase-like lactoylglutathione lyase family enzyme